MEDFNKNLVLSGLRLYKKGNFKLAIACLSSSLKNLKEQLYRHVCYVYVVMSCIRSTDFATALDYTAVGLSEFRDSFLLHFMFGLSAIAQSNWAPAEKHLRVCVSQKDDIPLIWYYIGFALQKQGDIDSAYKHYIKSRELGCDKKEMWFNLGSCALLLGKGKQAKRCLSRSLSIDASYENAWFIMGLLNLWSGKFKSAAIAFSKTKYMDKNPGDKLYKDIKIILCFICAGYSRQALDYSKTVLFKQVLPAETKKTLFDMLFTTAKNCFNVLYKEMAALYGATDSSREAKWTRARSRIEQFFNNKRILQSL